MLAQTAIPPRHPDVVMKLARMGSFHQSRLSFMRVLLRRLKRENWRFDRPVFDVDAKGVGVAVYSAHGPDRSYSLIAFAHDLPPDMRSDRVIATAWDATFTLFDGVPTQADIDRLSANVPLQEAGRVSEKELSVSRANRSVRLWEYVVDTLSKGQQPDAAKIAEVGYLMRTTAVYGSGKLGAADRELTCDRPEFLAPFQIEMLSVFLTRNFVMHMVEHLAQMRAPDTAVKMVPDLRRGFGIGNSTGLGMAPYLINHPVLLNNWITARETALARVRSVGQAKPETIAEFKTLVKRAIKSAEIWHSEQPIQVRKLADLRGDLGKLQDWISENDLTEDQPWNRLWLWAEEALTLEGQEQLFSLLLEPHGALIDDLGNTMHADEAPAALIDGRMSLEQLKTQTKLVHGWAITTDWSQRSADENVWYTSEEKLEPRLGSRYEEDLEPYELPLCPARDAARMYADILTSDAETVGGFLQQHPEHRHIARRVQIAGRFPYAEIRDNTVSDKVLPIDLLRAKLAMFGATYFDPRSDRWVRINMFQHAPLPDEFATSDADGWTLPSLEEDLK